MQYDLEWLNLVYKIFLVKRRSVKIVFFIRMYVLHAELGYTYIIGLVSNALGISGIHSIVMDVTCIHKQGSGAITLLTRDG